MSTLTTTKMSSRGQVVIPEAVRNEMGLKAGEMSLSSWHKTTSSC